MIRIFFKRNVVVVRARQYIQHVIWRFGRRSGPSSHIYKQRTIKDYARAFSLTTLVETGTYLGEMVCAMRGVFHLIYSIELSPLFYEWAAQRFSAYPYVRILQGDSGKVLPGVVTALQEPTLFWLDGHYSGGDTARADQDTPVVQEVRAILESCQAPFVILIDDARLFVGSHGYPTIAELQDLVRGSRPEYTLNTQSDIIRIIPERI